MFVPSFNVIQVKEYEVKENLVSLASVQNAFAPATPKDSMGSNGSKSCLVTAKTLKLQKKRSGRSTLPQAEEITGLKAAPSYRERLLNTVRLIRDKGKSWAIQAPSRNLSQ